MRLILDLDETLLDTLERQYCLLNALAVPCGHRIQKELYLKFKKQSLSNTEILARIGIRPLIIKKIHAEYIKLVESKEYLKLDSLILDYRLLEDLSEKHELHLCSMRSNPENSIEQLKVLGLQKLFKSISWVSHSENEGKVQSVAQIQERYGTVDYYIGDSEVDRIAADENSISFLRCDRGIDEINSEKLIQKLI